MAKNSKTKTLPFHALRRGTIFTLPNDDVMPHGVDVEYVKLGDHGARVVRDYRIFTDLHCIPARYDRCRIVGHIND